MAANYQVAVVPGTGIVLREGDTIVFIEGTERPDSDLVARLRSAALLEQAHDRLKQLARVLLDDDSPPPVAVIRLTGDEASVFLYGAVDMVAGSRRISGEGQVLGITEQVSLAANDIAVLPAGADTPDLPTWSSLGGGAVRGAGVVISAVEAGQASPTPAPSPDPQPASDPSPPPPSLAPPPPPPPSEEVAEPSSTPSDEEEEFEHMSLIGEGLTDRAPLPVENGSTGETDDEPSTPSGPSYEVPVEVLGVLSPRGFFNHPEARFCSRSGVKMGASHTLVLTRGPRPPLGVLTFDDGSTFSVRWNTVIGRDPSDYEPATRGEVAVLALDDETKSASRQHVMLELVDWDVKVRDMGSQNGTFVRESAEAPERRLNEGEQVVIGSDSMVRFGGRTFVYHAHHVQ